MRKLTDTAIDIKIKLAALWAAVMFCYVYGDFFTLFVPGRIENLMKGDSGAGDSSPIKLLLFAIMMTIPSLMIFISVAAGAGIGRMLNMIFGVFFSLIMVMVVYTSLGEWMIFYTYLGIIEIGLTGTIFYLSFKWPKIQ